MLNSIIQWCLADQDRALELGEIALVLLIALLIWKCPHGLRRLLLRAESSALRFYSRRKWLAILLIGLIPAVIRIALLPIVSYPIPFIADEMSHLLLADTIASGRLTNPPHPLSDHFEATYVVQKRVYGSVYPPAHGIVMGAAQALGLRPWYGVLAEVVFMLWAVCWMLDAWVPPRWVIVGAFIATVRLGMWMVSYWGGALAVVGGALIAGALRRLWDRPHPAQGIVLGAGLVILANTRPYEAALCGVVTAIAIFWIVRARRPVAKWTAAPAIAAMAVVLAAGAAWTGYYNWRVTGNALLVPNVADQLEHGTPTRLVFLPPPDQPPGLERFPDLLQNFQWQREIHAEARDLRNLWTVNKRKLLAFWHFFIHPLWVLPLLALPFALGRASIRRLLAAGAFVSFGTALYPFYFPHYSAPVAGVIVLLIVHGLRRLSAISRKHGQSMVAPMIIGAAIAVSVSLVGFAVLFHRAFAAKAWSMYPEPSLARHRVQENLTASGGRHLVIVRYGPEHNYHFGATYNRADIDNAPVVFARELEPASNERLLQHFAGRVVWLFEPDLSPPRLTRMPQGVN